MKQLTDLEKALFILLDGKSSRDIFYQQWDITEENKEEVLELYDQWEDSFHLIVKSLITDQLIRFDINRINPEDFYNQLLPGKWLITCTEKDYLINSKLVKESKNVYIKE